MPSLTAQLSTAAALPADLLIQRGKWKVSLLGSLRYSGPAVLNLSSHLNSTSSMYHCAEGMASLHSSRRTDVF
jgi:hypothetical protein